MDGDIRTQNIGEGGLSQELQTEDIKDRELEDVPQVKFPTKLFLGALAKDLGDLATAGILVPVFGIFHKIAIIAAVEKKHPKLRARMAEWLEQRIFMQAIEFVPIIGILPISSILVFSMYREEKREAEKLKSGEENADF